MMSKKEEEKAILRDLQSHIDNLFGEWNTFYNAVEEAQQELDVLKHRLDHADPEEDLFAYTDIAVQLADRAEALENDLAIHGTCLLDQGPGIRDCVDELEALDTEDDDD